MRHNLLSTSFTPMPSSPHHHTHHTHHNNKKTSSSSSSMTSSNPNHHHTCSHHSPSATLDILILILVLFSSTFLLSSYLSYILHSLSLLLPPLSLSSLLLINHRSIYLLSFLLFFLLSILIHISCTTRSRKCGNRACKGLKKAMEFDLQLQTEELLRSGGRGVKEVQDLPWKGGSEVNPDYECLRTELRKMAPVNGRAVLLFRLKCGCPVAKLEGWGPKRGRRNKKNLSLNHG